MRSFIYNIALFISVFMLSFSVVLISERIILNHKTKFNLPLDKKIIFLGHSHTQAAYFDNLIDSSINLGSSGESYFYTYIKLERLLRDNTNIKAVFVEYSNNNIIKEMDRWIWDDIIIQARYKIYSPFTDMKEIKVLYSKNLKSAFVCDVKSIFNNAYYIVNQKAIYKEASMTGGYTDLHRNVLDSMLNTLKGKKTDGRLDTTISETNIVYLQKIIELARYNGIKLFLVRSPLHKMYYSLGGLGNEAKFQELLKSKFKNADFIDCRDFPARDSEFGDLEHLNQMGAKRYSHFFNKLLKEGLLEVNSKQTFVDREIEIEKTAVNDFPSINSNFASSGNIKD